ncbi:AAA family ATPase [Mycoplasma sp. 744]|uniref:AAA family ATPase n=1 Tax=Mycoplasma sp. 744 TaxID=3108531 RepID=UPI002B1D0829|nr:AAA family ATPase [Mycoplasma sp. 744]MEA4115711.1 AAA family ATPase [Mycoplasma sp. 744]
MKNLANELRPQTLNQIIGQKETINLLKKMVAKNITSSFIFYGESGTGKSSTAIALANDLKKKWGIFNGTIDNKQKLLDLLETKEIIIIDEIHRLNKDKQDILLSYLEFNKIIVYATTTENPYFRVNPALRSRMYILQFNKLTCEEMLEGLKFNIVKKYPNITISDDVLLTLINNSNGDYRNALNNLQLILLLKPDIKNEAELKNILPNMNFYSDMNSSSHYNNLSAFHKSLRGSDVDAALYYGHLILKTGDYQGLFRRLMCVAYEDVGLADVNLCLRIEAAFNAVEKLGFPEANLPVTFAIVNAALAPKSNSIYLAMNKTIDYLNKGNIYDIPKHLKDSHYKSAAKMGDGLNYKYPHDYPFSIIEQTYLPDQVKEIFFTFKENDNVKLKEYYELINKNKEK